MKKTRGIFITFEGIDGCGKSTQAERLHAYLRGRRYKVLLVREPGGTPASEKIRAALLDRKLHVAPLAELLLYEAARAQLVETVILPALEKGWVVIADRFFDSTTAYQGYGRRLDKTLIAALNKTASCGLTPDITFILDVDYRTSLGRRGRVPDRLEKESRAFFNRVRRGFLSLAGKRRVVILDGRHNIETLWAAVCDRVEAHLHRKRGGRAG